jgi:hypothetical protein
MEQAEQASSSTVVAAAVAEGDVDVDGSGVEGGYVKRVRVAFQDPSSSSNTARQTRRVADEALRSSMKRPLPSSSYSSLTVEPPVDTDSEEEEAMAYVGSKSKASTPVHPAQTMQSARTSAAVPAPKSLQRLVSSTHAANSVPFSTGAPEGGVKEGISAKDSSASKRPRPAALAPPKVCLCAIHINQYFYECEHFVFCLVVDVSTLLYGLHGLCLV